MSLEFNKSLLGTKIDSYTTKEGSISEWIVQKEEDLWKIAKSQCRNYGITDEYDVEEICGDARLILIRDLKTNKIQLTESTLGYYRKIVKHKVIQFNRRQRRQVIFDDDIEAGATTAPSEFSNPETYTERRLINQLVYKIVVEELSPEQAETIALYFAGMEVYEIANVQSITEAAVYKRVKRALQKLKPILKHKLA